MTEVISVETARAMMTMLQAVVRFGTAAAASQLKHPLGGKTGTTNNYTDAWFIGFSPSVTCGTWIGFDDRQSLGEKETGARAALPMWMDFMKAAIQRQGRRELPDGGRAEEGAGGGGERGARRGAEERATDDDDSDGCGGERGDGAKS